MKYEPRTKPSSLCMENDLPPCLVNGQWSMVNGHAHRSERWGGAIAIGCPI